ncbi:IucA/IucC family C-terminal-domain containing protein [Rummeliibacillus stabekisii]|uniref:IucA/IucC family C-terminal-domain containing protein n=1 Tax=Rummeliibacillus stabekisii TaxID=241244 RepID=UPI003715904C
MESHLTEQEKQQLREFRFTSTKSRSELSIELAQLMDRDMLSIYLEKLSNLIVAPNLQTTASIFMKRYAFLAVIFLYSMTVYNKKLDISFQNISLESIENQEQWLPKIYFNHTTTFASTEDRNEWRKECIKELFAEHLFLIVNHLKKETKVSKDILWENIAIYICWLYETLSTHDNIEIRIRAKKDIHYLIHEAPENVLGISNSNFLKKYGYDFIKDNANIRQRKTCCLSYRLKCGSRSCNTCPLSGTKCRVDKK